MVVSNSTPCHVINFYKFINLSDLPELKDAWKLECLRLGLKGTILLAPEGINVALAGSEDQVNGFVDFIKLDSRFADIVPKRSLTKQPPFRRMEVKIKRWIIRFAERSDPSVQAILDAPRVTPKQAHDLILSKRDDVVFIDTRNEYETETGLFEGAVKLPLKCFTEFPDMFEERYKDQKDKYFVFYCTGGVRCEKVVPWAIERGFTRSTQIDGGILKYFEEVGQEGYEGTCFVFDDRRELGASLIG